jgi:hypothetical protein
MRADQVTRIGSQAATAGERSVSGGQEAPTTVGGQLGSIRIGSPTHPDVPCHASLSPPRDSGSAPSRASAGTTILADDSQTPAAPMLLDRPRAGTVNAALAAGSRLHRAHPRVVTRPTVAWTSRGTPFHANSLGMPSPSRKR